MNELLELEIVGFQSHVKSIIKPAPAGQLTVIVGPSDSGKSAIIRDLKWTFYDTPRGTDFINVKGNMARATLTYLAGTVIRERHRTSFNRYKVNDQTFEGFGHEGVPAEVMEITGVRPVAIGDLELNLNLSEQLDGPFLGKSVSGFVKAKVLGKLAGTEEVDFAAAQIKTDLFRRKAEEKTLVAQIERDKESLAKYDYLEAMGQSIIKIRELLLKVQADQERKDKLVYLSRGLFNTSLEITKKENEITEATDFLLKAQPILEATEIEIELRDKFSDLLSRHTEITSKIAEQDNILSQTSLLKEAETTLKATEANNGKLCQLTKILGSYRIVSEGLKKAGQTISLTENISQGLALLSKATEDFRLISQLKSVFDGLVRLKGEIAGIDRVLDVTKGVPAALKLADSALEAERKFNRLSVIKSDRGKIAGELVKVNQLLEETGRVKEAESKIVEAEQAAGLLSLLVSLKRQKAVLTDGMVKIVAEIKRAEDEAAIAQENYIATLKERGVCELCGAEVSEESIRRVI